MRFKPRNPMIVHLVKRKSGAHDKPFKAKRRKAKQELQREYGVMEAQHPFKVPGLGSNPSAPTNHLSVWESLVIRQFRELKNAGSNPATLTILSPCSLVWLKALVWGIRERRFESCHGDQTTEMSSDLLTGVHSSSQLHLNGFDSLTDGSG